jgi:holo-[acyl-carrier protein] synthase
MIGIGIDTVEVARMREALLRTPRFAQRFFTPGELAVAARRNDPSQRLAARFAAKEAAWKCLGVGLWAVGYHDIEVIRTPSGKPELLVTGRAREIADAKGVTSWQVSMTHTDLIAEAVVVAL